MDTSKSKLHVTKKLPVVKLGASTSEPKPEKPLERPSEPVTEDFRWEK